jgi:hypothetical protein
LGKKFRLAVPSSQREALYTDPCVSPEMKLDLSERGSNSFGIGQRDSMRGFSMLFAYFGPETMMPVASVIVGVVMLFGRSILVFGRGLVRRIWPGPRRR